MTTKEKIKKILDFILYRKEQGVWLSKEHMEMATKSLHYKVSSRPMNLDSSIEFQVKNIDEAYKIISSISIRKQPTNISLELRSELEELDIDPSQSFYLTIKRIFLKKDLFYSFNNDSNFML